MSIKFLRDRYEVVAQRLLNNVDYQELLVLEKIIKELQEKAAKAISAKKKKHSKSTREKMSAIKKAWHAKKKLENMQASEVSEHAA